LYFCLQGTSQGGASVIVAAAHLDRGARVAAPAAVGGSGSGGSGGGALMSQATLAKTARAGSDGGNGSKPAVAVQQKEKRTQQKHKQKARVHARCIDAVVAENPWASRERLVDELRERALSQMLGSLTKRVLRRLRVAFGAQCGRWCKCPCDVHLCSLHSALCATKTHSQNATLHTHTTAASLWRSLGPSVEHIPCPIDCVHRLDGRPLLLMHVGSASVLVTLVCALFTLRSPRPSKCNSSLFLQGTADKVIDHAHSHDLFAKAREPKILLIVEDAGHTALYDKDRDAWTNAVFSFLTQHAHGKIATAAASPPDPSITPNGSGGGGGDASTNGMMQRKIGKHRIVLKPID
jgi:pimeloyl-ACP methyl ester carboxylesterase